MKSVEEAENVPMYVKSRDVMLNTSPALFNNQFQLNYVSTEYTSKGLVAHLLWTSRVKARLDYHVTLSSVDFHSKEIRGISEYDQDCFQREVSPGTQWLDTIPVRLTGAAYGDQIGVMIYRDRAHILPCLAQRVDFQIRAICPLSQTQANSSSLAKKCVADSNPNVTF